MAFFSKKNKEKTTSSKNENSFLKITTSKEGAEYTLTLEGRLDAITSPDLEAKISEVIVDANKLIFDLGSLEYISSAGLRALLGAAQEMEDKGDMIVRNLTSPVSDVFKLTGFSKLFNIE